nr:uncharacterized protein LOC112732433 isoform X2 [Arachis hypogaea]XP_029147497.1 uncharacterized protein LOC112732433 isoform X2 [Arachis hypogaea]
MKKIVILAHSMPFFVLARASPLWLRSGYTNKQCKGLLLSPPVTISPALLEIFGSSLKHWINVGAGVIDDDLRLFELYGNETKMKLLAKELAPLQNIGSQNCITFSVDGSKFSTGGSIQLLFLV